MCKKLKELHDKTPDEFLANTKSLPINIESILVENDIKTLSVSFKKLQDEIPINKPRILGMAYAINDDLVISYDKDLNTTEKRFVLAHELGHSCLHMNDDSLYHIELYTQYDVLENQNKLFKIFDKKKEDEADCFARELLIPTNALLWMLNNKTQKSIDDLSSAFDVPKEQMIKKLQDIKKMLRG